MYKIVLATRYLVKRRITYFAVLAVALCVFIVVVVMTVMTGLVGGFKQKNHSFTGDCVVGTESLVGFAYYEDFGRILEKADFVQGISPVIKNFALVTPAGIERNYALEIMGVDPVRHSKLLILAIVCTIVKTMCPRHLSRLMTRIFPAVYWGSTWLWNVTPEANILTTPYPAGLLFL